MVFPKALIDLLNLALFINLSHPVYNSLWVRILQPHQSVSLGNIFRFNGHILTYNTICLSTDLPGKQRGEIALLCKFFVLSYQNVSLLVITFDFLFSSPEQ